MMGYGHTYSRRDILEAYRACVDAGMCFFDTAEVYAGGESERLLGGCRRHDGRPVVIASKYAPAFGFARWSKRWSPRAMLGALDGSLKRLGVERIDLYQIHFPTSPERADALIDVMAEAVHVGKVRAVGVSNYGVSLMRRAHARLAAHGIALASNEVHYSLLYRYPEINDMLNACRELNVALIAYNPLEQGILSGKYREAERCHCDLSNECSSDLARSISSGNVRNDANRGHVYCDFARNPAACNATRWSRCLRL